LKVAVCPDVILTLAGCDVIVGATDALAVTVRMAGTEYGEFVQVYPP